MPTASSSLPGWRAVIERYSARRSENSLVGSLLEVDTGSHLELLGCENAFLMFEQLNPIQPSAWITGAVGIASVSNRSFPDRAQNVPLVIAANVAFRSSEPAWK